MLFFLKVPSGDGVGEIFCMLVLGESDLRLDAKDAATRGRQKRFDITAVFLIVNFGQLLPNGAVGDFFRGAFEDYGLDRKSTRLNSSHRTISYAVFCLKKKNK